jgi:hypothetical protein
MSHYRSCYDIPPIRRSRSITSLLSYSSFSSCNHSSGGGSVQTTADQSLDVPWLEESENLSRRSSSCDWSLTDHDSLSCAGSERARTILANVQTESSPPKRCRDILVEVTPGVRAPLRGSDDTWRAIQEERYMPSLCNCCNETIFAIQDVGFVLCPNCNVIYPIEDIVDKILGGVGLGFTYDDLIRWQPDIQH